MFRLAEWRGPDLALSVDFRLETFTGENSGCEPKTDATPQWATMRREPRTARKPASSAPPDE